MSFFQGCDRSYGLRIKGTYLNGMADKNVGSTNVLFRQSRLRSPLPDGSFMEGHFDNTRWPPTERVAAFAGQVVLG